MVLAVGREAEGISALRGEPLSHLHNLGALLVHSRAIEICICTYM